MAETKCDLGDPNNNWAYCPSSVAAMMFAVLFGLSTVVHVIQSIQYRQLFALTLITGAAWEFGGYISRIFAIEQPDNSSLYTVQQLLILLAPLWINAFVYMWLGRMVHFYLIGNDRICGIRARRLTLVFVMFDVTAFLVQATGGLMPSGPGIDPELAIIGLHIYTGGVALQITFIGIFLVVAVRFHRKAKSLLLDCDSRSLVMTNYAPYSLACHDGETPSQAATKETEQSWRECLRLLSTIYGVIGLILMRNFYRLAEYASGIGSSTLKHEWFPYVFDAAPMLSALLIVNLFHPGTILKGPNSDFSEENQMIKQRKRERREEKKRFRAERKVAKTSSANGWDRNDGSYERLRG